MRTPYLVAAAGVAGFSSFVAECRAAAVIQVAAGGYHSVLLRDDGTVWVCGPTSYGILGDTKPEVTAFAWPYEYSTLPVQVTGKESGALAGVVQIAAGQHFTLALRDDGTIWAWGSNSAGQLGDGTLQDRHAPIQVKDLSGVKAVSASTAYSMALLGDGTVRAWASGQADTIAATSTTVVWTFTSRSILGGPSSRGAAFAPTS